MNKFFFRIIIIAALVVTAFSLPEPPALAAEKKAKEKLAVLDLDAKYGIEKSFAEALSVIVRDKLHSFGEYQVMSKEDIQAVASREQLMQAVGSDDGNNQNLVDFGRTIGTRYMVAGDISKIGATYTVSLRMLDTKGEDAGVTNRVSESCKCQEDALIVTVQDVAAKLVGKPTSTTEAAKKLVEEKKKAEEKEKQRLTEEKEKRTAEIDKMKMEKSKAAVETTQKHPADNMVMQNSIVTPKAIRPPPENPDEQALAKAMSAYLQYSKQGIEVLANLAKGGNPFSGIMLARIYRNGIGLTEKDEIAAKRWQESAQKAMILLERLADKGDVIALSWLGNLSRDSEIPEEQGKAVRYFEKAAQQGYGYAMTAMGWMYDNGKGGVTKDEVKALEWNRKAADKGEAAGMVALGWMYAYGKGGLNRDEVKAVEWYQKAVEKGNSLGMARLGHMYAHGKGGLAQDEFKAVEWYQKAAEKGEPLGMNNLGSAYRNGEGGLPKNESKAVELFRKAAEKGHPLGMANLGTMYETGKGGLPKDLNKALEWYKKAGNAGNERALKRLKELSS